MPKGKSDREYWRQRFIAAEAAHQHLKSMTKKVPANTWTPEYKALAEAIHTVGRDVFYYDSEEPKTKEKHP